MVWHDLWGCEEAIAACVYEREGGPNHRFNIVQYLRFFITYNAYYNIIPTVGLLIIMLGRSSVETIKRSSHICHIHRHLCSRLRTAALTTYDALRVNLQRFTRCHNTSCLSLLCMRPRQPSILQCWCGGASIIIAQIFLVGRFTEVSGGFPSMK